MMRKYALPFTEGAVNEAIKLWAGFYDGPLKMDACILMVHRLCPSPPPTTTYVLEELTKGLLCNYFSCIKYINYVVNVPQAVLGIAENDSFSMEPPLGPSGHSVLRGKGHGGVNVTFYFLIFHRQGGRGGRICQEARLVRRKPERHDRGAGTESVLGTAEDNSTLYYLVWVLIFFSSPSQSDIANSHGTAPHAPTHQCNPLSAPPLPHPREKLIGELKGAKRGRKETWLGCKSMIVCNCVYSPPPLVSHPIPNQFLINFMPEKEIISPKCQLYCSLIFFPLWLITSDCSGGSWLPVWYTFCVWLVPTLSKPYKLYIFSFLSMHLLKCGYRARTNQTKR